MVNLRSSYFEVRCEAPGCQSTLRVEATHDYHHETQSLALRARDGLISHGWTDDRRGLDMCPSRSAARHSPLAGAHHRSGGTRFGV